MIFGHHPRQGLYDPQFEHDACGVAFVATMTGVASHKIVEQGLEALRNLDHRGATGADPAAGGMAPASSSRSLTPSCGGPPESGCLSPDPMPSV